MATYSEQLQRIFDRYLIEVDSSPVSLDLVADWAIQNRLFMPEPRDIRKLCRDALADSLRQEKRKDSKGRMYRAKHSVRESFGGVQVSLWADIDKDPPRTFMKKSFSQRRKSIADDCFQAKQDVDHYNDAHPNDEPIQLILDFSDDVAEMEAAEKDRKKRG